MLFVHIWKSGSLNSSLFIRVFLVSFFDFVVYTSIFLFLLNSVSLDGKVFVWKISEGSEGEDQPQITGKIVLALQILGEEDTKHPRVCWHCHKQVVEHISFATRSCIRFFLEQASDCLNVIFSGNFGSFNW